MHTLAANGEVHGMAAGEQAQWTAVPADAVVTHLMAVMRERRAVLHLTQGDVAEKMGITRNHYQLLESGRTAAGGLANPRLSTLVALAAALDVTLHDLMPAPGSTGAASRESLSN